MSKMNYHTYIIDLLAKFDANAITYNSSEMANGIICSLTDDPSHTVREGNAVFLLVELIDNTWTIQHIASEKCSISKMYCEADDDVLSVLVEGTLFSHPFKKNTYVFDSVYVWEVDAENADITGAHDKNILFNKKRA
jgi:hypothetical protein